MASSLCLVCAGPPNTYLCANRYRTREEMGAWRARDPVVRFRNWLVRNTWWDEGREQELRQHTRQQVSTGTLQS